MQLPKLGSQPRLNMEHSIMNQANAPTSDHGHWLYGAILFHVGKLQMENKQPCGIQEDAYKT